MAEYNKVMTQIKPDLPKVIDTEQIYVYVPKASYDQAGIMKPDKTQFVIAGDYTLTIKHFTMTDDRVSVDVKMGYDNSIPTTDLGNKDFVTKGNLTGYALKKLENDSAKDKAYIEGANGTGTKLVDVSDGVDGGSIVKRDAQGRIFGKTTGSAGDNELVNIGYIEARYVKKSGVANRVYTTDNTGADSVAQFSNNAIPDTMAYRAYDGSLRGAVVTPTDTTLLNNKYVSEHFIPVGDDGKVPPGYLPDGFDDVLYGYYNESTGKFYEEYDSVNGFSKELIGVEGKLYADKISYGTYIYVSSGSSDAKALVSKYSEQIPAGIGLGGDGDPISGWSRGLCAVDGDVLRCFGGVYITQGDIAIGDITRQMYYYQFSLDTNLDAISYQTSTTEFAMRNNAAKCVAGNKLLAFGGLNQSNGIPANSVGMGIITNGHSTLAASGVTLPHKMYGGAAAYVNGKVYLFGGIDENDTYYDTIYEYDLDAKTLTLLESKLPNTLGRIQNSVCVIGTKVYIIGVRNENHLIDTRLYIFDSITKSTKVITDASTFAQGENVSVAAIGNKIYAFGGYTHADGYLTSISEYTINGEQITRKLLDAKLPYGMINMTTGVLNGRVYLFGGDNGDNVFFRDILIFDPVADAVYIRSGSSNANTLTLGTAHSNAFYGDLGYKAYKHSQTTGNPHNTQITDITGLKTKLDTIDTKLVKTLDDGNRNQYRIAMYAKQGTYGVVHTNRSDVSLNGTLQSGSFSISAGDVITMPGDNNIPIVNGVSLSSSNAEITLPLGMIVIANSDALSFTSPSVWKITIRAATVADTLPIRIAPDNQALSIPLRDGRGRLTTIAPSGNDDFQCVNVGYWKTNYKPFNYTTISTLSAVEHGFNVEYQIDGKSAEIEIPLEGTDDIIVDIDETNKMINIHLDAKVRAKLAKMLTLPAEAPAKNSIVGVGTNNAQMIMTEQEARDAISVYKTLSISQTDYDNLAVKDNKTLYLITG